MNYCKSSLATLAIWALVISNAFGQRAGMRHQIGVEGTKEGAPAKLADIENDQSGFNIKLAVDREDKTYKVGDTLTVSFTASKSCYLTLFNVDTKGKVQILFPNQYHQDNLVKAGETYRLPQEGAKFVFRAQGPGGTELLKAIATLDEVQIVHDDTVKQAGAFKQSDKPQSFVAAAVDKALGTVESKRWSEAELIVKVIE